MSSATSQIVEKIEKKIPKQNDYAQVKTDFAPVDVCEWVIEADAEELARAELFGYEKGAFTGANQMKAGLFETGSGGTVFLDEIGELSLSLQAKLLKAVEEKRIRRVGASCEIPVDLRVIAATSRNLRAMVAGGEFRADLYDRLNVLALGTIPLREQKEKIRELVVDGLERERIAVSRRKSFQTKIPRFRFSKITFGWKFPRHEERLKEIETDIAAKLSADSDDELGELPFDDEADRKRWDELKKDFDRVFLNAVRRTDLN